MLKTLLPGSARALVGQAAFAEPLLLEKDKLTPGFIKLTDLAPLSPSRRRRASSGTGACS